MKNNYILFCAIVILLLCNNLKAQYTFQHWAFSDYLTDGGSTQIVNIDGDATSDRLYSIYDEDNVIAAGWESRSLISTGYVQSIEMPDFPVAQIGVIDIDQDSDGDLLFIHQESGLVYVSEQVCEFEFNKVIRLESAVGSYAGFKIHDMNGDGIEDLIGFSKTSSFSHIMELGLGNSMFGSVKSLFIGYTTIFSRRYQDMNGDGITDITIATGGASRILYYPGLPNGGWGSEIIIRSISNAQGTAIGDIDGDGLPDMVAAQFTGNPNTIRLSRNLGNDEYELISIITGEIATFAIACADANNDGLDDILISNKNGFGCWLYINKGNYNFDKKEIYDDGNARATFSDVNSDGKLDVLVSEVGSSSGIKTYWMKGDGSGGYSGPTQLYPLLKPFPSFYLHDFTKDGIVDKITYNALFDKGFFWMHEGLGNGRFQKRKLLLSTSAISHQDWKVGFMDGNENIDLIFLEDNKLFISTSTSNGAFITPELLATDIGRFMLFDKKNSLYTDLVLLDKNKNNAYLGKYNSDGLALEHIYEGSNLTVFAEDIEKDGHLDLIIDSRPSTGRQMAVINNKMEGLTLSSVNDVDIPTFQNLSSLGTIDYDLDGISDILFNSYNDKYKWLKGKGDGTYETVQDYDAPNVSGRYSTIYLPEEAQTVLWNNSDDYSYFTVDAPESLSAKKYMIPGETVPIYRRADIDNDGKTDLLTSFVDGTIGWATTAGLVNYGLAIIRRPCHEEGNGVVRITSKCFEAIQVTWSDGFVGSQRDDLLSGIYSYSVSLNNELVHENEFELLDYEDIEYTIQTKSDSGSSNGAFRIVTVNGTQPSYMTWTSDGGQVGTRTEGLSAGIYTVSIAFFGDCLIEDTFTILSSVDTKDSELDRVRLLPNIAQEQISIIGNEDQFLNYQVVSKNGRPVLSGTMLNSFCEINISMLPTGIYFCKLANDKATITRRFVVVR